MANNKNEVQMPSSQGGLVQYFDADTGIQLDPKIIIATGVFIAVFIQMAKMIG